MYNLLDARRVETWMTVPTGICILIDTNYQLSTGLYIKVKFSLYRPWRPLGLREVEAPTFSDIRLIVGGKVVSSTSRPLFIPRKIPGSHFC
jgi:hypothetical protein